MPTETEREWTPGKWTFERDEITNTPRMMTRSNRGEFTAVADFSWVRSDADGQLMARSPELVEALEAVVQVIDDAGVQCDHGVHVDAMHAARALLDELKGVSK